ncbi:MAG TPA: SPOR domain-containing protein [Candidatus Eremiobacteraeota bacterium]|nr:MAG: Sporulation-specific N-acetylmuramoyl-L-alanine amidase [bacterium ADurb.Bin363]HPZ07283.1 SPOR domain-containing protein [Candidatus Eremiobacteraeota bacterium]
MASKRKRKKVDLYWPTVFILAIGVLVGALFLGKYIGDIFVTGGNLNSSEEESSYSPQIKTLAKPTIISQSKTLAQEKDNTQIILPPSFNTHPKGVYTPKAVSTPVAKVTPTVGVEKNKEIEVSVNVSAPTPVISSMANKNLDSVTDNNSGKTDSEIDKMINTTSNNNITTETEFDRVELNEEKSGEGNNSSYTYKVQAGFYVNKDNANKMADNLSNDGYDATVVQVTDDTGKTYYRVQAGAFNNKDNAKNLVQDLKNQDYNTCIVKEKKDTQ